MKTEDKIEAVLSILLGVGAFVTGAYLVLNPDIPAGKQIALAGASAFGIAFSFMFALSFSQSKKRNE